MEWVKLGEVVEFVLSGEWGKEVTDLTKIASPVIRTTNFNNDGTIDYKDIVYRDIDLEKKQDKLIKKGDILIEKSGGSPNQPVGRVVYFDAEDSKFFNNNFTSILRLNTDYHSKYIFYLFRYLYKIGVVNKFQNKTTGIINLKLKDYLQQTNVLIHKDKEEQKVCSESLDLIFDIISTRKAQIAALDELVQSVFYEMFGDPLVNNLEYQVVKLNKVSDVRDGTHDSPKYINEGYPLLTSKNVTSDGLILDSVNYISEEDFIKINKRSEVNNGDIIMPMIGTIGRPYIVNENFDFAIKNLALIKLGDKLLNIYLKYLLSERFIGAKFELKGGTQKFISLKLLRSLEIPLPPLELQEQFANKVEAIESQKTKLQASLEEMETLFNALMQEAFSGNLG